MKGQSDNSKDSHRAFECPGILRPKSCLQGYVEASGGPRTCPLCLGLEGDERDSGRPRELSPEWSGGSGDPEGHSRSSDVRKCGGSPRLGVCADLFFTPSREGRRARLTAGSSALQLLARLDARPLAARAAADLAALVRRSGATLGLRPKDAISELDSADIEVTDSRLPNPTFVEHRTQHRRSETLGTCIGPPQVTQVKACASKPPQASGRFCVELVRSSAGFGLTLSGGRDASRDAPLAVRGLLKDGPAQRCGRLQAGDLVLQVNRESIQGLTHAQVVDRIRTGGPRLHLMLSRPLETHPSKTERGGGLRKGNDRSPDPGGPEVTRSRSSGAYPLQHPQSHTTPKTRDSPEPSPEGAADGLSVSLPERRTEDPDDGSPGSPGPWLVPSEERLSRALGVPGSAQLSLEMAAGR